MQYTYPVCYRLPEYEKNTLNCKDPPEMTPPATSGHSGRQKVGETIEGLAGNGGLLGLAV